MATRQHRKPSKPALEVVPRSLLRHSYHPWSRSLRIQVHRGFG